MLRQPQLQPLPPADAQWTKADYYFQCLIRLPEFRDRVLKLHCEYPPVFVPRPRRPLAIRWPKKWRLPVEHNTRALVGRPKTIEDLVLLNGFVADGVLAHSHRRLSPHDGAQYFSALGSGSVQSWKADLSKLGRDFPNVPPQYLRFPWAESFGPRPKFLLPGGSPPAGVIALIPVYGDTTEEDVGEAWKAVIKLLRSPGKRGRQRRARPDSYPKKLRVYDSYWRLRDYSAVSRELKMPESTVRRVYGEAFFDIHRVRLNEAAGNRRATARDQRAAGIDPQQFHACPRCFTNPRDPFCPSHRASGHAYIDQDFRSLREILGPVPQQRNNRRDTTAG
jgi:hypothetical protein